MPNGSEPGRGVGLVECLERMQAILAEAIELARRNESPNRGNPSRRSTVTRATSAQIDFSSNIRAFVKRYALGMSGPQKFVLLLAYLTKGDLSKRVSLEELEGRWNKMTAKGLLSVNFNRVYSARARENDWVTTEKSGLYFLRPAWREIFREVD